MSMPDADGRLPLTLADVARHVDDLPALPDVALHLLQTLDDDELDVGVLARKMAHDQALTAKALRFANSSAYGGKPKVTTIQQAITVLGINNVRQMIMAAAMTTSFAETPCAGFDHQAFWRHSIGTAVCAKVIARRLHLNQDLAFTAGLLHDIGRLVIVSGFRSRYEQVLDYRGTQDCQLVDAERALLGIDHVGAGAALAAQWRFGEAITHAIEGHHQPHAFGAGSIASLINVADAIAHALDLSGTDDDLVPPVAASAWHGIGFDDAACQQVLRETELEFGQFSAGM